MAEEAEVPVSNEVAASSGDATPAEETFSNVVEEAPRPPTDTVASSPAEAAPAESEPAAFDFKGLDSDSALASNAPAEAAPAVAAAEPEPPVSNEVVAEEPAPVTNEEAEAPRPPTDTVASTPSAAAVEPEAPVSNEVAECSAEAAAEAAPVETILEAPPTDTVTDAEPPRSKTPPRSGSKTPPEGDADGKKKWDVDMSYIDRRTKDISNLENRRKDDEAATGTGATATPTVGTKDDEGKWKQVDTGYIDYRTKDTNRLEARRSVDQKRSSVASQEAVAGAGQAAGSATTRKQSDGKWAVDVSYIGYRTGDTANLDRKLEDSKAANYADPAVSKFPYEAIIDKQNRPKEVDPAKKEAYLSDAEFQTILGVEYGAFYKLPKWKQQNLKKAKDLF